ncbi:hypothetical protein CYLTODRAFT_426053 [Cylindrobasidium torrendii FP15055 ss-10]|uniref:Uncharacterized protein n=1 Tax=Cylindrobasidium torrendii FP15055 ss-10 TaxID=1314674 RepID=A0A0D7AZ59_9AGAR|nr:hypothetical protein CYLTODRAFT_426053 [Cylindrobasidium torrendii FP15055 ss-10]
MHHPHHWGHPHHHGFGYYRRWHGRPSRLLWFLVGACTTAVYYKHREAHEGRAAKYWDVCKRHHAREQLEESRLATWRRQLEGQPRRAAPDPEWDAEKARLAAVTRQTQDAFADFSESTLDSLLNTVVSMKQKLIQRREERAREDASRPDTPSSSP